jgi:hypothetical protein
MNALIAPEIRHIINELNNPEPQVRVLITIGTIALIAFRFFNPIMNQITEDIILIF